MPRFQSVKIVHGDVYDVHDMLLIYAMIENHFSILFKIFLNTMKMIDSIYQMLQKDLKIPKG